MPFTLAHPAAAVPLRRVMARWGVLSALVIGSMTPDFAYWFPSRVTRAESHSLEGLFWFCLPMGLAAYALFHLLLKRPAVLLLPEALRIRLQPLAFEGPAFPTAPLVPVMVSILVGAMTHLVWDSFTHGQAPAVAFFPVLRATLFEIGGYPLKVYKLAQHASTFLGLLFLVRWTARWLRARPAHWMPPAWPLAPALRTGVCAGIVGMAAVIALGSGLERAPDRLTLRAVQIFVERAAIDGLAALVLPLLVLGLLERLATSRARDGSVR
jgi:hypothetical protein